MTDLPYRLGIEDTDPGDSPVEYAALVCGDAEKASAFGGSADDSDTIHHDGGLALLTGEVWGGLDAYAYAGFRVATAFSHPGRVTVHIDNGHATRAVGDVSRFREVVDWPDRPQTDSRIEALAVGNPHSNERVEYHVAVDGVIRQLDAGESGDTGAGGYVDGRVRGGWDRFAFEGRIAGFNLGGDAQVEHNGVGVSAADLVGFDSRSGSGGGHGHGGGGGGGGGHGGANHNDRATGANDGNWTPLATRNDDPRGAPVGAAWYRTDRDARGGR